MMQHVGQVIGLRPEAIDEYERLHREVWPEVLACIAEHGIRNYSIFRHGTVLFAYFEYEGHDWAGDMAALSRAPDMQQWLARVEPLQIPLPGGTPGEWWATMPLIFHTD